MPAQTRFLNPHFFGFCGLYYLTDKYFVFAGMISSPTELYSSGILIVFFYLHKLVSYHRDQETNFSQLILCVDTTIIHNMPVPKKFLVSITRHKIDYFWTTKFSALVQFIGWQL